MIFKRYITKIHGISQILAIWSENSEVYCKKNAFRKKFSKIFILILNILSLIILFSIPVWAEEMTDTLIIKGCNGTYAVYSTAKRAGNSRVYPHDKKNDGRIATVTISNENGHNDTSPGSAGISFKYKTRKKRVYYIKMIRSRCLSGVQNAAVKKISLNCSSGTVVIRAMKSYTEAMSNEERDDRYKVTDYARKCIGYNEKNKWRRVGPGYTFKSFMREFDRRIASSKKYRNNNINAPWCYETSEWFPYKALGEKHFWGYHETTDLYKFQRNSSDAHSGSELSAYIPKPADMVLYTNSCSGRWDHCGIVSNVYTINGKVYINTIEGNVRVQTSGKWRERISAASRSVRSIGFRYKIRIAYSGRYSTDIRGSKNKKKLAAFYDLE